VKCHALEFSSPLDVRAGAHLARIVRRENVSILHCHLFIASLFASGIARMAGVARIIETCHGPEVWRIGKRLRGSFWVDRQIGRFTDRYIAVSHAAARHLIENKRVPRSKITVIHNGRELGRYSSSNGEGRAKVRVELGLGEHPTILTIARLDDQKGHRHLLDAIAQLSTRWPRLIALLAGDGPLEGPLRARAEKLGIAHQVRFLGYREDVPELLAAADLVVLPSLYEGLPLVAIETLAAGKPIVATAVDGTPEVVIEGKTGLLVAPADSRALAAGIDRMLSDPAMAQRMGAAGRSHVQENFTLRKQIQETIAVYRELTGDEREGKAA
jgi:glycosyltransferase involved in cell wall biosynthesis